MDWVLGRRLRLGWLVLVRIMHMAPVNRSSFSCSISLASYLLRLCSSPPIQQLAAGRVAAVVKTVAASVRPRPATKPGTGSSRGRRRQPVACASISFFSCSNSVLLCSLYKPCMLATAIVQQAESSSPSSALQHWHCNNILAPSIASLNLQAVQRSTWQRRPRP